MGAEGDAHRRWVERVETTEGNPPENAADLVLKLVGGEGAVINGQFLWIDGGLQAPLPSWDSAF